MVPIDRFRLALRLAASARFFAVAGAPWQPATAPAAEADPLNPEARVPRLLYESTLSQYQRRADDKPVPWNEANDNVARIGGWRAYAREANEPDAQASAPDAPSASSRPDDPGRPMRQGHGGHKPN